jgi:hypothetical protein
MKKIVYLILVVLALPAFAQRVGVSGATENIDKIQRTGLKTVIDFDRKKVADAWESYLRKYGKVSSSKNIFTMEAAKITTISDRPVRIVSKVESDGKDKSYVFYAIDAGSAYITSGDSRYGAAEQLLKDFAIKMYKDAYGDQVGEAEKVYNAALKSQTKLTEKDKDMQKDIQNANNDIAEMEKKIEEKKKNITDWTAQIENNKVAKVKAAEEVDRTKKIVDQMKLKMGEIR